jgi:hypothetical protein
MAEGRHAAKQGTWRKLISRIAGVEPQNLTFNMRWGTMLSVVLDGAVAVPCTRNPL